MNTLKAYYPGYEKHPLHVDLLSICAEYLYEKRLDYRCGALISSCEYFDDKRHGEYKQYYCDGILWVHCFYRENKLEGEYRQYHSNGVLWVHCFYRNGRRDGELKLYLNNGNLHSSHICSSDKK